MVWRIETENVDFPGETGIIDASKRIRIDFDAIRGGIGDGFELRNNTRIPGIADESF
jgi:hypothetical protein